MITGAFIVGGGCRPTQLSRAGIDVTVLDKKISSRLQRHGTIPRRWRSCTISARRRFARPHRRIPRLRVAASPSRSPSHALPCGAPSSRSCLLDFSIPGRKSARVPDVRLEMEAAGGRHHKREECTGLRIQRRARRGCHVARHRRRGRSWSFASARGFADADGVLLVRDAGAETGVPARRWSPGACSSRSSWRLLPMRIRYRRAR